MKQLEEDKENLEKQVNCDEHDSDEKNDDGAENGNSSLYYLATRF